MLKNLSTTEELQGMELGFNSQRDEMRGDRIQQRVAWESCPPQALLFILVTTMVLLRKVQSLQYIQEWPARSPPPKSLPALPHH